MKLKTIWLILIAGLVLGVYFFGRSLWVPMTKKIMGKKTTAEVISLVGDSARASLLPYFKKAGVQYPPQSVTLVALKQEQKLELWVRTEASSHAPSQRDIFIREFDIKKLSGEAGPKLKEGDGQVPEGFYKVIGFNPNSAYHLSMKLDYPNLYDLQSAKKEGRLNPGSNIFIHGKAASIGCLAMGDKTIETLFVLTHDVGMQSVSVVISPRDPRTKPLKCKANQAKWICDLYWHLDNRITIAYKRP